VTFTRSLPDIPARRVNLTTSVLGQSISMPVILGPCGLARMAHPEGELAAARAATGLGTLSTVSSLSGHPLEQIAAQVPGPRWFQLYFLGGRGGAEILIKRAAEAGYAALVVTIDTPALGNRERDLRNRMGGSLEPNLHNALAWGPRLVFRPRWLTGFVRGGLRVTIDNAEGLGIATGRPTLGEIMGSMLKETFVWDDLRWIKEQWNGPVVIKGVMSGDQARRAVDAGASAVVVSNHGGRQLDGDPSTLSVLPEVCSAVGDQAEVLFDGGVRRGAHVAKAIAMGARAALVGRPWMYGLGVAGEEGVERVLRVFRSELVRTLTLLGCDSIAALDRSYVTVPDAWSAGSRTRVARP
jgi:isopentenyl diphosphate isomerase/L-lactate dehydrogenase-like FMN-dependent dehydrogenase